MKAIDFDREDAVDFPNYCKVIRDYLNKVGFVNFTPTLRNISAYWEDFSESCYCASFLFPEPDFLEHFAEWLSDLDI